MGRLADAASKAVALSAVAGVAYLAVALVRVRAFARQLRTPENAAGDCPPITILKPLRGSEPHLEANLATFFEQDYPSYQIVLSVTSADDPALAAARRIVACYPHVDAEIVVAPAVQGIANPKIANALNAVARAKYGIVAMVDADMRVDRRYLAAIAAAFSDDQVGAVTCLYGGVPDRNAVSALSAMFVNDHFIPSVLVAGAVEPLRYTFGSTMAFRRDVLERAGGLAELGRTIADDHRLGALMAEAGMRVVLAPYVVANVQGSPSLGALWQREVRWSRTTRSVRPLGSTLAVVTYALPLALGAWLLRPRSVARAMLLGAAAVLRMALHDTARSAFAPEARPAPHLIPARDLLALAVWAVGRTGRSARWKGDDVGL